MIVAKGLSAANRFSSKTLMGEEAPNDLYDNDRCFGCRISRLHAAPSHLSWSDDGPRVRARQVYIGDQFTAVQHPVAALSFFSSGVHPPATTSHSKTPGAGAERFDAPTTTSHGLTANAVLPTNAKVQGGAHQVPGQVLTLHLVQDRVWHVQRLQPLGRQAL
jgi:hypothetical protein